MKLPLFVLCTTSIGASIALLSVALFSGCGSSSSDSPPSPSGAAPDGSPPSSSPGTEASTPPASDAGSTPQGPYTIDDYCQRFTAAQCTLEQSCCAKASYPYNPAGCAALQQAGCSDLVASVKAGKVKFDPSKVDACLQQYKQLFDECVPTTTPDPTLVSLGLSCDPMFTGLVAVGQPCNVPEECAPSTDNTSATFCDLGGTNTCVSVKHVAQGASCAQGDVCQGGYCAIPAGSDGGTGTCQPFQTAGQACPALGANVCAEGLLCVVPDGGTAGTCVEAKAPGEPCTHDAQCQSFSCRNGTCSQPLPYVAPTTCGADAGAGGD